MEGACSAIEKVDKCVQVFLYGKPEKNTTWKTLDRLDCNIIFVMSSKLFFLF
jgi:hypothetical protein